MARTLTEKWQFSLDTEAGRTAQAQLNTALQGGAQIISQERWTQIVLQQERDRAEGTPVPDRGWR